MTYRAWYITIASFVVFSCLVWAGKIFEFGSFLYVLASYLCYSVTVMLLACKLCGKDLNVDTFFVWILNWPVGVAVFVVKAHLSVGWTENQIAGCYVGSIIGGFLYSMLLGLIVEDIIASRGEKE